MTPLRIAVFVLAGFLLVSCVLACSNPSYNAPYDLSLSPLIRANSTIFPYGWYNVAPCGVVNTTLCPIAAPQRFNQTQCFALFTSMGPLTSDGLGQSKNSVWSPLDNDWRHGAVSVNTDVDINYDQCDYGIGSPFVKITYICGASGDDTMVVVREPNYTRLQPCVFEFVVDSSIVCSYVQTLQSQVSSE